MQKYTFHRAATALFSDQQNRLVYGQEELLNFINRPFQIESFSKQAESKKKSFSKGGRDLLVEVLKDQYQSVETGGKVLENIDLLADQNSFTVTTGHQIPVFTGPLFFIYKLLHVIRLSEELNKLDMDFKSVPVYWMATEDHDFDEVKWVEIFGRTIEWNSDQSGPVGRFHLEGFDEIKREFAGFFSGEALDEIESILKNYEGETFAEATFKLVNHLFGRFGLVIINADHPKLKSLFSKVIEKELKDQFSLPLVEQTNTQLEKEGLKVQVHAREVNLFYIEDGLRERIIRLEDGFFIEGRGKLSLSQILKLLTEQPECFSPNVVLRPIYQEMILPNLCYVGGLGEIAYWLQLKAIFEAVSIPYPLLSVRNSLLWIDAVNSRKLQKIELHLEELFLDTEELKKRFVLRNQGEELDMSEVEDAFDKLKDRLMEKVQQADPGLEKNVLGELVRMEKQIHGIRDRMYRSIKARHEQSLVNIDQLKAKLFPNNGLQERSTNLFQLCAGGKVAERIDHLHDFIDPFEKDFIVIRE